MHEPTIALTDNSDGLSFYLHLSKILNNLIKKDGVLLLEIGLENTKNKIESIFKNYQYKWHKDLNNNYRIIEIYHE